MQHVAYLSTRMFCPNYSYNAGCCSIIAVRALKVTHLSLPSPSSQPCLWLQTLRQVIDLVQAEGMMNHGGMSRIYLELSCACLLEQGGKN